MPSTAFSRPRMIWLAPCVYVNGAFPTLVSTTWLSSNLTVYSREITLPLETVSVISVPPSQVMAEKQLYADWSYETTGQDPRRGKFVYQLFNHCRLTAAQHHGAGSALCPPLTTHLKAAVETMASFGKPAPINPETRQHRRKNYQLPTEP